MEIGYGIKPGTEHYCRVVDMLGRVGRLKEALRFAEELGKEENVVRAWGSVLFSCRIHGEYELVKIVGDKLVELDESVYHVLVSNVHADEGNWEDVDRVRMEMIERGLRKNVGCSWIEIGGGISCFVSKDKSHERCEDVYKTLEMLAGEMMKPGRSAETKLSE